MVLGMQSLYPLVLASQFELKIGLLNLVTSISFHGFENDDPHSHIRSLDLAGKKNLLILSQLGMMLYPNFEADPRVLIILGRPFLRTTKALVDLYEEKLTRGIRNKESDSHHEEFADELAHIISSPEYDHFFFDIKVDPGELTRLLIENSYSKNVNLIEIKEDNELKTKTLTKEFSEINLLFLFPSINKDKNFDLVIFIIKGVYSKRSHILPLNDFSPTSFVNDLLLTDPSEIETFLSFPFGNEDKVFDPGILLINGVLSLMRKSSHLLNDNFKIDKRHISSEVSLKIKSLICFHPKDKEFQGSEPIISLAKECSRRPRGCSRVVVNGIYRLAVAIILGMDPEATIAND
uniref:Reverse transcriptase domain-containing protein n=1 Tax=Tanacetum cinerariifolium TaxID=118510 RepID=A0A699HCW1_TANCI|nr:hypothetical protein [Tanacetum cinerariifolium]